MITAEVRADVLQRSEGRCEECGQTNNEAGPAGLHLHHTEYLDIDTPGNLRALCPRCHRRKHPRRRSAEFARFVSFRLREVDLDRLARLAAKMDRDHSWLIRQGIELLAEREGIAA